MLEPKSYFASLVGRLLTGGAAGAAVVIALRIGFALHNQVPPPEFYYIYYPALALFTAAVLVPLVWLFPWMRLSVETRFRLRRQRREHAAQYQESEWARRDAQRRRAAALAASPDPNPRKYAARVNAGDEWSDARIAYYEDTSLLVTCVHLQPIEHRMRAAGLEMRYYDYAGANNVQALCAIDKEVWQSHYPDSYPVEYVESAWYERAAPTQELDLVCAECHSRISVTHPSRAGDGPWFPAPPTDTLASPRS